MARKKTRFRPQGQPGVIRRTWWWFRRWAVRLIVLSIVLMGAWIVAYKWVNPPTTLYMEREAQRRDGVQYTWVDLDQVSPHMVRAVVAAEDADFCNHRGVDYQATLAALQDGARRGASTISQQTVKNAFLWQGRSWIRKGLEVVITPVADWVWGKERMIEIYLNIAEFDTKVFGIEAAAWHHFGVPATDLNRVQAGRLAAVLPDPRDYSAVNPTQYLQKRASSIIAGADMIRRDGRAACFQD